MNGISLPGTTRFRLKSQYPDFQVSENFLSSFAYDFSYSSDTKRQSRGIEFRDPGIIMVTNQLTYTSSTDVPPGFLLDPSHLDEDTHPHSCGGGLLSTSFNQ